MKTKKLIILLVTLGIFLFTMPILGLAQDEIVKFTGDIEIEKNDVVNGDVVAMTGDIKIAGTVNGNVTAFKGNIYLENESQIRGDVVAFAGKIYDKSGASVSGNITELKNSGFKVIADRSTNGQPEVRYINRGGNWGTMFFQVIGLAALSLIGLSLFSNSINNMNLWLQANTSSVLIKGFLGWLALPFLLIALVVTIIGIPIAGLALLLIPIPLIVGLWVVGLFAGDRLMPILKKDWEQNLVIEGVVGVAIIWLAIKSPFIGFLIIPAIAIIGLGVIIDSKFGTGKPWFNKKKGDGDDVA